METDMQCRICVFKHLACALSYGKEILNGHGKGKALDHRIDFLGQLVNLEHHLELFNEDYAEKVRSYRESLQNRSLVLKNEDLAYLRELFKTFQEDTEEEQKIEKQEEAVVLSSNPSILFLNINKKEYFDVCYKMIKRNMVNFNDIYYQQSSINPDEYTDLKKVNLDQIKDEYIIVFRDEKYIPINKIDCNIKYDFSSIFPIQIKKEEIKEYIVNKDKDERTVDDLGFILNRKLCCTNRYYAQTKFYCKVENNDALNSMKQFLQID